LPIWRATSSDFMKSRRVFILQIIRRTLTGMLCLIGLLAVAKSEDGFEPVVIEGKDNWLFPGWESLTIADTAGIDQCINLIRQVSDQLAAKKIGLLVVVVPMKASIYPGNLPDDHTLSREVVSRYAYILSQMSIARIVTLDLRQALLEMTRDRHGAFYRTDYHWTAWASEAVTILAAKEIRNHWNLAGKPHTGMRIGPWVDEKRYGDLANLLPNDRRREIGEEVFTVRQNVAEGNLLDDAASPVRVVGNSFSQPYLGFSQTLSHVLDRPVGLTWNFGNVGPWKTLLQFIQSREFKEQKPQVIVWQFNEGQFMNGPDAVGKWDVSSILAPNEWLEQINASLTD